MPVCIEDECNSELPPASLLFRAARQYAYGVLFSLAETHRRLERLALRKRAPLEGRTCDLGRVCRLCLGGSGENTKPGCCFTTCYLSPEASSGEPINLFLLFYVLVCSSKLTSSCGQILRGKLSYFVMLIQNVLT